MPICGVIGCANRPGKAQFSFFRTPKVILNQGDDTRKLSEERRRLWKAAIRRGDIVTEAKWDRTLVCSKHFVNGEKAYLYRREDPSWLPTILLGYDTATSCSSARYDRLVGRKRKRKEFDAVSALLEINDHQTDRDAVPPTVIAPADSQSVEVNTAVCNTGAFADFKYQFGAIHTPHTDVRTKHMADTSGPDLTAIKTRLLSGSMDQPVVFHDLISSWPSMQWSPAKLTYVFSEQTFKFRLGRRHSDHVQWETECCYEYATVSQFVAWTEGHCSHDNPLAAYGQDVYWCYADYVHMHNLLDTRPDLLKSIDWAALGFNGRDGHESTFWMGSEGAYTVCHYDTYGCNLVAQIHGRKRWVMFPPSDTDHLYPTRMPYEESSVFSLVNVRKPDFTKHPRFKNVTPYIVTLAPGDVLFVPRHWWHLVESLDTTVSINTWIDMEVDATERLREAVVRTTVFALMSQESHLPLDSWLNPTEDLSGHEECLELLNKSVRALTPVTPGKTHNSDTTANETVTHGDDTTATLCPNGKTPDSVERSRKRSRISNESSPGHHDKLGHSCIKCTPIISKQFDRTHVQWLRKGSLKKYLGESVAIYELAGKPIASTHDTTSSKLTCPVNVHTDSADDTTSVDKQKMYASEAGHGDSCDTARDSGDKGPSVTTTDLVDCIVHPDVIALICQKLMDRMGTMRAKPSS